MAELIAVLCIPIYFFVVMFVLPDKGAALNARRQALDKVTCRD